MKSWIMFLITSFFIIANICGETSLAATSVDSLAPACVFLIENETEKANYGSGFLVIENNNLYLVTAAHIASFLNLNSPIIIAKNDGSPATFSLKDLIPTEEKPTWILHEHADIAVLSITSSSEFIKRNLAGHFIPKAWIESTEKAPERNKTITIIGFPFRLGATRFFSPISRDTQPASSLLEIEKKIYFITQDPAVGGFSGAPVFDRRLAYNSDAGIRIVSGDPILVGIVHGTLSDNTGGKFGAMVPGYLILETINKVKN